MSLWKKFLILTIFILSGCTPMQAQKVQNYLQREENKPKISYYPYLARPQFNFLSAQNVIGVFPGQVIVPAHDDTNLELQLNANNWWGIWPNEMEFLNYFIAEQAKRYLGCGYLPAGTKFTLKPTVYTFKRTKISLAYPLTWQLKVPLTSICQTPSKLDIGYFKDESASWDIPFSQNKIYP